MQAVLIFLTAMAVTAISAQSNNLEQPANCSQQMDSWQMCRTKDLARSPNGKILRTRIDAVYENCSSTMPKNCTFFWKAAGECFQQEVDKADTDAQASTAKRQLLSAIDQCFQRTPNDPFADLFEELYPEMVLFDEGSLKPPAAPSYNGRRFVPPAECAPTPQNLECVSKEMANLVQDSETRRASAELRKQKKACSDKLTQECSPQSPPLWMCVDRALKQHARQTEDVMQQCMQSKGFPVAFRPNPMSGPAMGAGGGMPPVFAGGPPPMPPSSMMNGAGFPGGNMQMMNGDMQQQPQQRPQQPPINWWNF